MLIIDVEFFTSHLFGSSSVNLRLSFANFVKSIYIKNIHVSEAKLYSSLEIFTAGRLMPLDKNPG